MTGAEYAALVAQYVVRNYASRGVKVYREVGFGKTIIGKNRRIDTLVVHEATQSALGIECKYQGVGGTADEKIPYALEDLRSSGLPVCLAYAGTGFSPGILLMLAASPIAAQCMPVAPDLAPSNETRELDLAIALAFRWWDVVVRGKTPLGIEPVVTTPDAGPQLSLGDVDGDEA
jgi:hypothetical protein